MTQGHKVTFSDDEYVHYMNDDGFTCVYICQYSSNCPVYMSFIECQLCLNKAAK